MLALAANGRFASGSSFEALRAVMAAQPLHEAAPARPGDGPAALGFALALARCWLGPAGLIFIGAQTWGAEEGALSPRGLLAFGIDPEAVLAVHVRTGKEALWTAEQTLEISGATVVCTLADREVDLTASRRLLLKAEKSGARALLVRALRSGEGAMQSAAFTRWRVAAAASAFSPQGRRWRPEIGPARFQLQGGDLRQAANRAPDEGETPYGKVSASPSSVSLRDEPPSPQGEKDRMARRLLGASAWRATLMRRRGGAAGESFDLEWNGDVLRSRAALAGDLAEAAGDRPAGRRRVA